MHFSDDLLDEIRARLPVSHVVSRRVKLRRQGREFIGLSPFKQEKTPSFTVNDQKQFYHCFASGEHGDIFKFVMAMEGLSFPEAVERLAEEAGVAMPVKAADAAARQNRAVRLREVTQASCRLYEAWLDGGKGRLARDYLAQRGVSREMQRRFRLGFAPNDRFMLKSALTEQGFAEADLCAAGMLIHGPDIAVPYDRFRGRVMFPISDSKGRVIAFGGRALDPNQKAKYLNSPETELFHKGHILFNAASARQPAHERGNVIVVEGYMDVIALAQFGFANAVAPLGTALTETQLQALWRMADEPTLCLDGDGAGRRAAQRALEVALPHLAANRSLRFAFLPNGLDPDDLLRASGGDAFAQVISRAAPLSDVLWQWQMGDATVATPEARAAIEEKLYALVRTIRHQGVRDQYNRLIRDRLWHAWRNQDRGAGARPAGGHGASPDQRRGRRSGSAGARANGSARSDRGGAQAQGGTSASLRTSAIASGQFAQMSMREALIVAALLNQPWVIDDWAEELTELDLENTMLAELKNAIIAQHASQESLDRKSLRAQLEKLGYGKSIDLLARAITHKSDRFISPDASPDEVERGLRHILAMQHRLLGLRRELADAERAYFEELSESALAHLADVRARLNSAEAYQVDEQTQDRVTRP